MNIDVKAVFDNANERANWNKFDLDDIIFEYDGRTVVVPKKVIEDFKFCGLNNTDFILMYDWPNNPEYI